MAETSTVRFALAILIPLVLAFGTATADEIRLDNSQETIIGDYECSAYRFGSDQLFQISDESANQPKMVPARKLWTFFHEQGIEQLNELTLSVDIQELPTDEEFGLESLELLIFDSATGDIEERFTLGNNSLILSGSNTLSFRPECKLKIDLGFDFMERFSNKSDQIVMLNVVVDKSAQASHSVFVEGKGKSLSAWQVGMMFGFCAFWGCAFLLLRRFTLPSNKKKTRPQAVPILGASTKRLALDSDIAVTKK